MMEFRSQIDRYRYRLDMGQILNRQILDRYRYRLDIGQILKQIKIPIDRLDRNFEQLEEKIEGRVRSISLIGKLTFEL